MTALATAGALAFATPALAVPAVITDVSGTPDAYQIFGVGNSSGNPVFGTSPANNSPQNVQFTGGVGSSIALTINNGFAQIKDANAAPQGTPNWTQLLINPELLFTDMKFAISLTGATNDIDNAVNVYVLLSGGPNSDANVASNYTFLGTIHPGTGNNINFELTGGVFNGLRFDTVSSGVTLGTVKQMSYTPFNGPGGVPEPSTWAMMLIGFGGIGLTMRRRRQNGRLLQIA